MLIVLGIPFFVYACFHVAKYTNTTLLMEPSVVQRLGKARCEWWQGVLASRSTQYQRPALRAVAGVEVACMPALLVALLTGYSDIHIHELFCVVIINVLRIFCMCLFLFSHFVLDDRSMQ
jgi:hypothetical protein